MPTSVSHRVCAVLHPGRRAAIARAPNKESRPRGRLPPPSGASVSTPLPAGARWGRSPPGASSASIVWFAASPSTDPGRGGAARTAQTPRRQSGCARPWLRRRTGVGVGIAGVGVAAGIAADFAARRVERHSWFHASTGRRMTTRGHRSSPCAISRARSARSPAVISLTPTIRKPSRS